MLSLQDRFESDRVLGTAWKSTAGDAEMAFQCFFSWGFDASPSLAV